MREFYASIFLASVLLLCAHLPSHGQEGARLQPQGVFAVQVRAAMGIPEGRADCSGELATVMDAQGKGNLAANKESLAKLVDALNAGARLDAFIAALLATFHIDTPSPFSVPKRKWRFGDEEDRRVLEEYLWQSAKKQQVLSPEECRKFARAAILLSVSDDFCGGWWPAERFVKEKILADLTGLSEDQTKSVRLVLERYGQAAAAARRKERQALELIDDLCTDLKRPADPAKLQKALAFLPECWPLVEDHSGAAWRIISVVWILFNIVRDRGDQAAVDSVQSLLKSWRDAAKQPDVKRWLNESLERVAPPPKMLIGRWRVLPNGEKVPVDKNGKIVPPDRT